MFNAMSSIVFDECDSVPTISQTLDSSLGNKPANIRFIGYREESGSLLGIDRDFTTGLLTSQVNPVRAGVNRDLFFDQAVINNSTASIDIPAFTLSNYRLVVSRVTFVVKVGTSATGTVDLYTDDGKGTKICGITTGAGRASQNQIFVIDAGDFDNEYEVESTDDPLHMEYGSASNMGTFQVRAIIEYEVGL